jgi:hypothetical protein
LPRKIHEQLETTEPTLGSTDRLVNAERVARRPTRGRSAVQKAPRRPRRRRRWTRVDWLAAAIVLAQFIVRTRGAASGYWWNDDWGLRHAVAVYPFDFIESFRLYAAHLYAGPLLLFRLVETIAPGSFDTAVLVGGVFQAAGTLLVYLLLRRLFGPRPMIALLLLWFAFTTLTLTSTQGVFLSYSVLPFHIAFAGLALLLLRYLDRPSLAGAAGIVAGEVVALCWYDRAIFIPLALFALAAWFPVASPRPIGTRRALWQHRGLWLLLGGVLTLYVALYLALSSVGFTTPGGGPGPLPALNDTFELVDVVFRTFATSVFGGPWRWTSGSTEAAADPPLGLSVLALVLLGVFVAWTSARRRNARRAWLCLFAYVMAQIALIAYARLGSYSPDLGRYYRYFADAAIPATLVFAFALLPTRWEQTLPAPSSKPTQWSRILTGSGCVGFAAIFLVSAGISTAREFEAWSSNPGRQYVANAENDFRFVGGHPLISQRVPPGVLGEIFAPINTTPVILSLSPGHPDFSSTVDELFAVDRSGHIRPAQVVGFQSLEGPVPNCGWLVSSSPTLIAMGNDVFAWTWYVRVRYRAPLRTSAEVALGKGSQPVVFQQGTHDIFFPLVGEGRNLEIRGVSPSAGLCVESVTVGNLDVEVTPATKSRAE